MSCSCGLCRWNDTFGLSDQLVLSLLCIRPEQRFPLLDNAKENAISANETQQLVLDLLWAVNSPSLLRPAENQGSNSPLRVLHQRDIQTTQLVDFMAKGNTRSLGRYFERLISFWLRQIRQVDVLHESFVIRVGKRTVGEIDFIFIDEHSRMTHWEVAVKFYLFSPDTYGQGSHYLGPNAVDTLDRKLERLLQHQLPRSEKLFPDVEVREPYVKGRIFYPQLRPRRSQAHLSLSDSHLVGSWVRHADVEMLLSVADREPGNVAYRLLDKPHWLAEVYSYQGSELLMSSREILVFAARHFSENQRCLLIAQLEFDGAGYCESGRFFVVPNDWPAAT